MIGPVLFIKRRYDFVRLDLPAVTDVSFPKFNIDDLYGI